MFGINGGDVNHDPVKEICGGTLAKRHVAPQKDEFQTISHSRKLLRGKGERQAMGDPEFCCRPSCCNAIDWRRDAPNQVRGTSKPRLNCCDELILRSKGLDDPSSPVAGIDLLTSTDQPERFEEGHVPFDCFPVAPECHGEF
jgi:hypothetical protein